jgi:hypothetical protein
LLVACHAAAGVCWEGAASVSPRSGAAPARAACLRAELRDQNLERAALHLDEVARGVHVGEQGARFFEQRHVRLVGGELDLVVQRR